MKIRSLVVDDEPLARERLRLALQASPDFEVSGECRDGLEAVAFIRKQVPEVVFLDVQMPELDGFGVVEKVGVDRMPLVVFVTAYDRHALRAFDVQALDYLLKPFDDERLAQTLARVRTAVHTGGTGLARQLEALLQALRRPQDRVAVKAGGRIYFVRTEDVDWIEAAGNYVRLHVGAEEHVIRETLGALEAQLDSSRFVRIHRSTIVNVDRIRELHPLFHGEYAVRLQAGTELTLSRAYRYRLEAILGRQE